MRKVSYIATLMAATTLSVVALAQLQTPIDDLNNNPEYVALKQADAELSQRCDSLTMLMVDERAQFRALTDSLATIGLEPSPELYNAFSDRILQLEQENFDIRTMRGDVIARINDMTQEWVLQQMNVLPEMDSESTVEEVVESPKYRNLVDNHCLKDILGEVDYAELLQAHGEDVEMDDLITKFSIVYKGMSDTAERYAITENEAEAEKLFAKFGELKADADELAADTLQRYAISAVSKGFGIKHNESAAIFHIFDQLVSSDLGGGHIGIVAAAHKQGLGGSLGLGGLFLAVDQLGQLVGQDLLGGVQLGILPVSHGIDLLHGQEGQHADALQNVSILNIAPVLVELVGSGLVGIQPHSAGSSLAHLLALGVQEQGDGHGVGILAQLAADQLGAAQHVGPLVVAAELHVAAVLLVQVVEVVGLHDHVVELQEAQALLHALLVALGAQHVVDGEAGTDLAEHVDVVQIQQPVGVVDHHGLALTELDEPLHLLLEAGAVVLDGLLGHHGAHVGTAGGVADHGGAAADQGDGAVAGHLQTLHQAQSHEVTHMQRVSGGVKADIEGSLSVVYKLLDFIFVRYLGDKATGNELVIDLHNILPFAEISKKYNTKCSISYINEHIVNKRRFCKILS